jgi:hypothetical protein
MGRVTVDGDGNLIVAEWANHRIRLVKASDVTAES